MGLFTDIGSRRAPRKTIVDVRGPRPMAAENRGVHSREVLRPIQALGPSEGFLFRNCSVLRSAVSKHS